MYVVESEITIDRPIDAVFAFVADNENDPRWAIPVLECQRVESDAPALGTKYTFASKLGPFAPKGKMETVVFQEHERIEWEGEGLMKWKARFSFEAVGEGTRIRAKTDFHPTGIFRLFEGMLPGPFKKPYDQQFQNLKQLLEG
jgi:carbon monoxide dehydrogenase subunit G